MDLARVELASAVAPTCGSTTSISLASPWRRFLYVQGPIPANVAPERGLEGVAAKFEDVSLVEMVKLRRCDRHPFELSTQIRTQPVRNRVSHSRTPARSSHTSPGNRTSCNTFVPSFRVRRRSFASSRFR